MQIIQKMCLDCRGSGTVTGPIGQCIACRGSGWVGIVPWYSPEQLTGCVTIKPDPVYDKAEGQAAYEAMIAEASRPVKGAYSTWLTTVTGSKMTDPLGLQALSRQDGTGTIWR